MKTCTKCGETKPATEFSKDASRRDGLCWQCKACDAKRYAANPDRAKARAVEWQAANPEKKKTIANKWYAANTLNVRAQAVEWQKANPEKARVSVAKWSAENPEAKRIHRQNRRARKLAVGGKLSTNLAKRLFALQRGKCACCRKPLGDSFHRDHRMPLALGGPNTDQNMQLLCPTCNQQKHAKDPIEFMQQRGFLL